MDTTQAMSLSDAIKTSANKMLFDTLLKNPEKRAKVLELLTQEGIVGSDENSSPNSARSQKYNSPIKKLQKNDSLFNRTPKSKTNNVRLESPSALGRRRALERLESDSSLDDPPQKPPSPQFVGIPKPFERLLEGVTAFCEIRSNGEDRSSAIKTMMQSMGATVKDNLCRGVTHVVLKDGLYTTYRKAKLLKIHVVSVLWLEAVRRHKFRVPESKFPAVCAEAYDADITKICQEVQKEYNDVIQDELNKTSQSDNRRSSETPIKYVTERKKSRSTIYGVDMKKSHNRTEIATPYKFKLIEPELSESDSYISVGSNSNNSLDIVPSSQDVLISLPTYQSKNPKLTKVSEEDSDEIFPESNLAQFVKDSFELKQAAKIRSPESILKRSKQKAGAGNPQISLDEQSLTLHVSTTDESNLNNTGNKSKSNNSSKNLLEMSNGKNQQISVEDDISVLNLHLSEDSSSAKSKHNDQNKIVDNRSTSRPGSSTSLPSSDVDMNKNKTRRRTVGLKKPTKKDAQSNKLDEIVNDSTVSLIEIDNRKVETKQNEIKRNTRRKTIFNVNNNSIVEEKENVRRKTRRQTVANVTAENQSTSVENSEEPSEKMRNILEESHESIPTRKTRRNAVAKTVQIIEDKNEKKTEENKSDSSTEKGKRRVRKLYNPNHKLSASQINWNDEPQEETTSISVTPPKKAKYHVPIKELPKILSAKAQRTQATIKSTSKSVPAKPTRPADKKNKRKSARALNFNSTSSEASDKESNPKTIQTPVRKSERIAKAPAKTLHLQSSDSDFSQKSPKTFQKPDTQPIRSQLLKTKMSSNQSPKNRRSTLDFVPPSAKKTCAVTTLSQTIKQPTRLPSIVCTRFHKSDVQVFQQIVKKLGEFVIEDEVTKRTTHLVAGDSARTVNLLRAIARGCWVLKHDWLYKSLEAGKWLQEEDFEMVEFSPAVQKCRLEKQSFDSLYSMDLFISCGPIFISRGSTPRCSDLEELVQLCGGRVVRFPRNAQVVVAERAGREGVVCVNEKWILDSITHYKMKKFKGYLLRETSPVL